MKINMKITKKDADIVALKNFLPERKFNETVIKILRAARREIWGTKIYNEDQRVDQAMHPSEPQGSADQKNNRRTHIRLVRTNTEDSRPERRAAGRIREISTNVQGQQGGAPGFD